jgi:hypothetical protein
MEGMVLLELVCRKMGAPLLLAGHLGHTDLSASVLIAMHVQVPSPLDEDAPGTAAVSAADKS